MALGGLAALTWLAPGPNSSNQLAIAGDSEGSLWFTYHGLIKAIGRIIA